MCVSLSELLEPYEGAALEERRALESPTRRRTTPQALALALRARIVLARADGHSDSEVTRLVGQARIARVGSAGDRPVPGSRSGDLRRPSGFME
ncbi:hypothetical protein [Micromonospora echinospora]|uniref:hypothetical protein n=1 Tax=Micromonospora echinospora TaxID=1877 RepID=UPI0036708606